MVFKERSKTLLLSSPTRPHSRTSPGSAHGPHAPAERPQVRVTAGAGPGWPVPNDGRSVSSRGHGCTRRRGTGDGWSHTDRQHLGWNRRRVAVMTSDRPARGRSTARRTRFAGPPTCSPRPARTSSSPGLVLVREAAQTIVGITLGQPIAHVWASRAEPPDRVRSRSEYTACGTWRAGHVGALTALPVEPAVTTFGPRARARHRRAPDHDRRVAHPRPRRRHPTCDARSPVVQPREHAAGLVADDERPGPVTA